MISAPNGAAFIRGAWTSFTAAAWTSLVVVVLEMLARDNPGAPALACWSLAITYVWHTARAVLQAPARTAGEYRAGLAAGVAIFMGLPVVLLGVLTLFAVAAVLLLRLPN